MLAVLFDYPLIFVAMLVSVAIWALAVWTIFKAPKFLTKWAWLLLTLFTFNLNWNVEPGIWLKVGLPLGAIYVLLFARFGPAASAARVEKARAQAAAEPAARRLRRVQIAYGVMAFAAVVLAIWSVLQLGPMLTSAAAMPNGTLLAAEWGSAAIFLAVAGVFAFLAKRPAWWGKFLCGFAGISWLGHGLIALFFMPDVSLAFYSGPPIIAGALAFATGVYHQIVDPRLGPAPRAA